MSACVASAPTLEACGHSAPTAKNFVATATPNCPVAGSRAMIDQVMALVRRIRAAETRRPYHQTVVPAKAGTHTASPPSSLSAGRPRAGEMGPRFRGDDNGEKEALGLCASLG